MDILKSKRFWLAVGSLLVVVANQFGLDIDPETLQNGLIVVVGWILGDSLRSTPRALMQDEIIVEDWDEDEYV